MFEETVNAAFRPLTLLAFEYNYQLNRLVAATCRADKGDTLAIVFEYSGNAIIPRVETRNLTPLEFTELIHWATFMPALFSNIAEAAKLTRAFAKF